MPHVEEMRSRVRFALWRGTRSFVGQSGMRRIQRTVNRELPAYSNREFSWFHYKLESVQGTHANRVLGKRCYFCSSLRVRCNFSDVLRSVSGMFLFIVSFFRSSAFNIGSMCRLTSSGVLGLFIRLRTTV